MAPAAMARAAKLASNAHRLWLLFFLPVLPPVGGQPPRLGVQCLSKVDIDRHRSVALSPIDRYPQSLGPGPRRLAAARRNAECGAQDPGCNPWGSANGLKSNDRCGVVRFGPHGRNLCTKVSAPSLASDHIWPVQMIASAARVRNHRRTVLRACPGPRSTARCNPARPVGARWCLPSSHQPRGAWSRRPRRRPQRAGIGKASSRPSVTCW